MAYTTIDNPGLFFNTVLWTGNGVDDRSITGVGFQPDWVWLKQRNGTNYHTSFDSVRGATKRIFPNVNEAEDTNADSLQAFQTDGFEVGTNAGVNGNTNTYVAWNWLGANGTASKGNGSRTSTVSVNTTAGFSIVSYTGTGSAATVGHGLGAIPKMFIVKNRSSAQSWRVYHNALGATKEIYFDSNSAAGTSSSSFNDTEPTSSVFSVGTGNGTNKSSENLIAYCFAEKKGYSKFASYTGQGGAGGQYPFIYTGFKPAWILIKDSDSTQGWFMYDNKRDTINPNTKILIADTSGAEEDSASTGNTFDIDFVSNGFKIRTSDGGVNSNGNKYIYMAFAENPFVTEGTKAAGTAR